MCHIISFVNLQENTTLSGQTRIIVTGSIRFVIIRPIHFLLFLLFLTFFKTGLGLVSLFSVLDEFFLGLFMLSRFE